MPQDSKIAQRRKREICLAAKDVFLEKEFRNTTMEDVVEASGMSKGGVYYYYKSTKEILYDLCFIGQKVRAEMVEDLKNKNSDMSKEDFLVEATIEKMFLQTDYIKIYAMFLDASRDDEEFKELRQRMEKEQIINFHTMCEENNMKEIKCLASEEFFTLMQCMYIGGLHFDTEDLYMNRSDLFRDIIRTYLRKYNGGEIK